MINKAVLQNILKSVNASKKPIAAVGGFHNGGLKIARTINDFGFKIVAVSDEEAGIVDLSGYIKIKREKSIMFCKSRQHRNPYNY